MRMPDDALEFMTVEDLLLFKRCDRMICNFAARYLDLAALARARAKLRPLIDPTNFVLNEDNDEEIKQ